MQHCICSFIIFRSEEESSLMMTTILMRKIICKQNVGNKLKKHTFKLKII